MLRKNGPSGDKRYEEFEHFPRCGARTNCAKVTILNHHIVIVIFEILDRK